MSTVIVKCSSTVDQMDNSVGVCSKCSLLQMMDRCHAELLVKLLISDSQQALHSFTAFQNLVKITEDETIHEMTDAQRVATTLLKLKRFNCTYAGGVITAVHCTTA